MTLKRFALMLILLLASSSFAQGTLSVAADVGFAPFAYTTPSGAVEGFSVDLINEIAGRLGYDDVKIIDVNYGSIFAGLFANRYAFVMAPTTVTAERAAQMLFTEPYMPTGLAMLAKSGTAPFDDLNTLKGKVVAVNSGSSSDTWATENADSYGFEVQRYNKAADGFQAVATGRATVALADAPVVRYTIKQNPLFTEVHHIDTGGNWAYAFRPDDSKARDEVENAIECAKEDGAIAALYEKWFGQAPAGGSSVVSIYPGYGTPDFAGYDASDHELNCP